MKGRLILTAFFCIVLCTGCEKFQDKDTFEIINKEDIVTENYSGKEIKYHKLSAGNLLNGYKNLSDEEANKLAQSIKNNPHETKPFYYIGIAEDIFPFDKEVAAVTFLYGQYRSAQDANCCKDETSFDFINNLPYFAPETSKYIQKISKEEYKKIFEKVLELDDKYSERISPIWACYNGQDAVTKDKIETYPKEEWAKKRQEVRIDYIFQAKNLSR